jgi:glyoxylase-like metal-dependent hydrolase (beta-lactamase superfamily II)
MTPTELAGGLWRWTAPHPAWKAGADWPEQVGCVFAEVAGGPVLIDPLVEDWDWLEQRLAGRAPAVLTTIEWHARSSAEVLERFGGTTGKPSGVSAFPIGRTGETVFYLPEHRALVPGDLLVTDETGLRLCPESWFDVPLRGVRAKLRQLLDLPVERVLVSHGEPVLTGAADALRSALA